MAKKVVEAEVDEGGGGAGGAEEAGRMGLHALVFESNAEGAFMNTCLSD